jgi:hypothetical protein
MPDYEILLDTGSAGLRRNTTYPVLDADFGDGYYASILIGDPNGVKDYTLSWSNVHRDHQTLFQPRTYNSVNVGSPTNRFRYISEFVYRRLGSGNTPFWFEDVDAKAGLRTLLLCRFIPFTLTQTQDRREPLLYSYSIQFKQIRGAPAQT